MTTHQKSSLFFCMALFILNMDQAAAKTATLQVGREHYTVKVFPCQEGGAGRPIQYSGPHTVFLAPFGDECIIPPAQPTLPANISGLFEGGGTYR